VLLLLPELKVACRKGCCCSCLCCRMGWFQMLLLLSCWVPVQLPSSCYLAPLCVSKCQLAADRTAPAHSCRWLAELLSSLVDKKNDVLCIRMQSRTAATARCCVMCDKHAQAEGMHAQQQRWKVWLSSVIQGA
jgi:hypothetical protein